MFFFNLSIISSSFQIPIFHLSTYKAPRQTGIYLAIRNHLSCIWFSVFSIIYKCFYIRIFINLSMNTYRVFFICNILKRIATASRNTVRYKFLFSFTEQMYSNVKIVSVLDCQHACIRQNFCVRICNYIGIRR